MDANDFSKFIDTSMRDTADRAALRKPADSLVTNPFDRDLGRNFTKETAAQVKDILSQMQLPLPESSKEYISATDGLLVFDNARGVVIRIEKENGWNDSSRANDSPWMIQPLASVKTATGSATVEVVPGVHFEKSDAESRKLYWKLASDGYHFWDERLDNVGRLPLKNAQFPEGVPVVIDRMAARPLGSGDLLNRAVPLAVFPWALEPGRSPLFKKDVHFWDVLAEQKQMISEGARKAVGYVMPQRLTPPADPQEVLYGDLKQSFRDAWPEDAEKADPQKMRDFWEKTARAKTEGRLVAGWNEDTYEGKMSKPKEAPNRARAYEERLNAAGIFDIEKSSLRAEVLSTIAHYQSLGEKKTLTRNGRPVEVSELRTQMPGANGQIVLRLPNPDFAQPAPAYEKRNGLSGISGIYKFPDHLRPNEIQAYAESLSHAEMRGDISADVRLQKMETLHTEILKLNPDLATLKLPEGKRTEALYHVALGAASGFNTKDMQFFISGNTGTVAEKNPTYAALLDKVRSHDRPEWVPAPETLEHINRQLEEKHAVVAQKQTATEQARTNPNLKAAPKPYTTRPANEGDREGIAALLRKNYFKSDSVSGEEETMVQRRIDQLLSPSATNPGKAFIAVVDGTPVAIASVVADHARGGFLVDDLYTRKDHERKGIAAQLLKECENFAGEKGETSIHLNVDVRKPEVKQFYQKRGWVVQTFNSSKGGMTDIDPTNQKVATHLLVKAIEKKISTPARTSAPAGLQAKAGKTTGRADIALNLAEGKYAEAALSATQQIVLDEKAVGAAAKLARNIAPVAKGLGLFAKKIPAVGAVVTAGYVLYEVGSDAVDGEFGRAGAALVAGVAETAGNIVGFGVGDGAREITRSGVIAAAGEEYAPQKSGLRSLAERGSSFVGKFIGDDTPEKIAQKQKDLIEGDPVLPKTVQLDGKNVPLTAALRDDGFRKQFRDSLVKADGKNGLHLGDQIENLATFEALEQTRRQLTRPASPAAAPTRSPDLTVP